MVPKAEKTGVRDTVYGTRCKENSVRTLHVEDAASVLCLARRQLFTQLLHVVRVNQLVQAVAEPVRLKHTTAQHVTRAVPTNLTP